MVASPTGLGPENDCARASSNCTSKRQTRPLVRESANKSVIEVVIRHVHPPTRDSMEFCTETVYKNVGFTVLTCSEYATIC
jgi:hypothetical protein